jgi:group I intron endonuclease
VPFYLYIITSPTGSLYVGVSNNPKQRMAAHRSKAKHGGETHLARAMRKYGADLFVMSVVETHDTPEQAKAAERLRIKELQPSLNMTEGGDGILGFKHSEAMRALTSARFKGVPKSAQHVAKVAASNRGQKRSEEVLAKLRAVNAGRKPSAAMLAAAVKANTGRKLSSEHLAKLRVKRSAETRALLSERARNRSPAHTANLAAAHRKRRKPA